MNKAHFTSQDDDINIKPSVIVVNHFSWNSWLQTFLGAIVFLDESRPILLAILRFCINWYQQNKIPFFYWCNCQMIILGSCEVKWNPINEWAICLLCLHSQPWKVLSKIQLFHSAYSFSVCRPGHVCAQCTLYASQSIKIFFLIIWAQALITLRKMKKTIRQIELPKMKGMNL